MSLVESSLTLNPTFELDLDRQFTNEIEMFAKDFGLNFQAATPLSMAKFRDLDPDKKKLIMRGVRFCMNSFRAVASVSTIETFEVNAMRQAATDLGVVIPDDFYTTVRPGDVLEIYMVDPLNPTQTAQVWRNFRFLELCSYDLLTLAMSLLNELFCRDQVIEESFHQRILRLPSGPKAAQHWEIEPHVLVEKLESNNRSFQINPGFCAPAFAADGQLVGFASSLRAEPRGSVYAGLSNVAPLRPRFDQ